MSEVNVQPLYNLIYVKRLSWCTSSGNHSSQRVGFSAEFVGAGAQPESKWRSRFFSYGKVKIIAYRSFHLWVRNLRCSQDVLLLKMINMRKIMFRFFFFSERFLCYEELWNLFFCFAKTNTAGQQFLFCSEGVGKCSKGFLFPFKRRDLLSVKGRNH